MRKLWKGVVLGGAVGAGVRLVQDVRSDEAHHEVGVRVGKAAAEAALVGGTIGWFLDRRDRKRLVALASSPSLSALLAQAGERAEALGHAAEIAVRKVQVVAEHAAPALQDVAETAVERLHQAAEVARPHVQYAADAARPRLHAAAGAARPRVDHALASLAELAEAGRQRASA